MTEGNNNAALTLAKKAKADEFYTKLDDIAAELFHYKEHFKDKVVLCNCDDPYESNFFKFFATQFNHFGLKKLICTCYDGSPVAGTELSLFEDAPQKKRKAYKIVIESMSDLNSDGRIDIKDAELLLKTHEPELLKGNGDFRSEECVKLLDDADIVVTNPPFSLFRDYVAQLVSKKKKFLIIGNPNAITYKEIFPLIKENKLWLGCKPMSKDMHFFIPQEYADELIASGRKTAIAVEDGVVMGRCSAVWFTNLSNEKRNKKMRLIQPYSPAKYPKYDNYDAINVDKVADIPKDYDGVMGVPISFLDQYCPEQFEIIGTDSPYYVDELGIKAIGEKWVADYRKAGGTGHITANMHSLCYYDTNGMAISIYKRILIRKIKTHADKTDNDNNR